MPEFPLNYKIPEVSQCVQILTFGLTESNFQLSMMLLCTLTQGKIAVKSLSYLKHFRRRFSGKLQPKVHSLTRFAAWEISSISQKIRSYSFEKNTVFWCTSWIFLSSELNQIEHLSNYKFLPSKFHLVLSRTLKSQ